LKLTWLVSYRRRNERCPVTSNSKAADKSVRPTP
jgi:hypothetical protein